MSYTGFENLTDAELLRLVELQDDSVSRELLSRLVDLHQTLSITLDETESFEFSEASDMIQGLKRQVDVLNDERDRLHEQIEHLEETIEKLEGRLSDLQLELKDATT